MNRVGGGLPGGQVAAGISAIGGSNRQIVIVIYMAKRASHIRVAIGQQESRRAMVEFSVQPIIKRVATGAIRGRKFGPSRLMFGV
jgi:hypothetical protein